MILDAHPANFRWIHAAGASFGAVGVWLFRGVLARGEKRHRVMERRGAQEDRRRDGFFEVLRKDTLYARYQLHPFISGTANMMLEPPLVYLVSRQLGASYVVSIGIVMVIPFTLNLATMPLWARCLGKVHVAECQGPGIKPVPRPAGPGHHASRLSHTSRYPGRWR